jgi:hypothetical protein
MDALMHALVNASVTESLTPESLPALGPSQPQAAGGGLSQRQQSQCERGYRRRLTRSLSQKLAIVIALSLLLTS